jgi:hypothetical protein
LPAPTGTGLGCGGGEALGASSELSGLMPVALLVIVRAGLKRQKQKISLDKSNRKRNRKTKRKVKMKVYPEETGIRRFL